MKGNNAKEANKCYAPLTFTISYTYINRVL